MATLCPGTKNHSKEFGRFDNLVICNGVLYNPPPVPTGTDVLNKFYIDDSVAGASPNAEYLLDVACGCLMSAKGLTTFDPPSYHGVRKTSTATDVTLRLEPNMILGGSKGALDPSTTGFLCMTIGNTNHVWTNSLAATAGTATYAFPLFTGFTNTLTMIPFLDVRDFGTMAWGCDDTFMTGSIRLDGYDGTSGTAASLFAATSSLARGGTGNFMDGNGGWCWGDNNYVTGSNVLMVQKTDKSVILGVDSSINNPNVASTAVGLISIGSELRIGNAGTGIAERMVFIGSQVEGLATFTSSTDTLFINLEAAPPGTYFYLSGTDSLQRDAIDSLEIYGTNTVIGCDPATTGVEFIDACPRTSVAPAIGDQLTNKTYVDAGKAAKEVPLVLDVYAVTSFAGPYNLLTTDEFVYGTGATNMLTLPLASGVTVGKYWLIRQQASGYTDINPTGADELMSRDGTVVTTLRIFGGEAVFIHRQTTAGNVVYFIA